MKLNGRTVRDPGERVLNADKIQVDGKTAAAHGKIYIILNKPAGCVTTRSDELGRKTVYDYLGDMGQWVFPVGRLDLESEGLLLFTNDTAFGNRLTDPRYKTPRTYEVTLDGALAPAALDNIRRGGVAIGRGETTGPASVTVIDEKTGACTVKITLAEGKNRELRRLFEVFNRKVLRLLRTDFGGYKLGSTAAGRWRSCAPPDAAATHGICTGRPGPRDRRKTPSKTRPPAHVRPTRRNGRQRPMAWRGANVVN